jgi:hypothetical protein
MSKLHTHTVCSLPLVFLVLQIYNLVPAQAFSANLISDSSRASTNVTSTMHIKIGIVHFPNSMAQSISWGPTIHPSNVFA